MADVVAIFCGWRYSHFWSWQMLLPCLADVVAIMWPMLLPLFDVGNVIAMFGWCYCHIFVYWWHKLCYCGCCYATLWECIFLADLVARFGWCYCHLLLCLADVIANMADVIAIYNLFVVFSWQIFLPGLADVIAICYCVWQMLLPIWLMLLPFVTCYVRQMLFDAIAGHTNTLTPSLLEIIKINIFFRPGRSHVGNWQKLVLSLKILVLLKRIFELHTRKQNEKHPYSYD